MNFSVEIHRYYRLSEKKKPASVKQKKFIMDMFLESFYFSRGHCLGNFKENGHVHVSM